MAGKKIRGRKHKQFKDDDPVIISFRTDGRTHSKLKAIAGKMGLSVNAAIQNIVDRLPEDNLNGSSD